MAINQGETVEITASFAHQPQGPVRIWIQRPGQLNADAPLIMEHITDTRYRAEYLVTEHGRHNVRVESSDPVSAEETSFSASPKRVRKPA